MNNNLTIIAKLLTDDMVEYYRGPRYHGTVLHLLDFSCRSFHKISANYIGVTRSGGAVADITLGLERKAASFFT